MYDIKITKKGFAWFNTGHPWIYKDDLVDKALQSSAGSVVNVCTESNRFLAKAFYNPNSNIALRIITRQDKQIDKKFWLNCIKKAADYRKLAVKDANAYRLVFSESDNAPGLVVDIYAGTIVMQISSLGMELIKEDIEDTLVELFEPDAVILRNDLPVRKFEGLKEEKSVLFGEKPELIEVFENDTKYLVDVWEGHKTGAYLDQRENRLIAGNLAFGRALDVFSYQGGFAMHMAKSASEVLALDSSEPASDILKKNVKLNNIKNITPMRANGFDKLKEFAKSGEKFDVIVLDPPAFAKSKKDIGGAKRGYKELNLRAMQCLNEGGYLVTFSCSYNFSESEFLHALRLAAADAKKELRLIAKLCQSKDHPILINLPESHYLKGFISQVK